MNRASPTISVVICTYAENRWHQLRRSVDSVFQQTRPPAEVLIVVDHNPELEQLARRELTSVSVLPNGGERGLSGARNSGAHAARGEIVVFLDDDAWPSPAWLERLIQAFDDPRTIGAGGKAAPAWVTTRPAWFPEEFLWVVGCSYRGLPSVSARIRNPLGCNMAFRHETFEIVGGFRTDFGRVGTVPVGAEETEFSIRVQSAFPRSHLMYLPEAIVYHEVPPARTTWSYFMRRCYGEGLSKAQLRRVAGRGAALASERGYLSTTIPSALTRELRGGHVNRFVALIVGVLATGTGFAVGIVRRGTAGSRDRPRRQRIERC